MNAEPVYQCPGEPYEISRSMHLGRLASFYPVCGGCPHRGDTSTFSARRAKRLNDVQRHTGEANPLFHAEEISGVYLNDIGPEVARRVGQALGAHLTSTAAADVAPRVFIAGDGRPWTDELTAAAAEGLRWAGCSIVDLGAATAPCLAFAVERRQADGAVLVGSAHGEPREVGLTLWGSAGEPMSSPGLLDGVRDLFHSPAPRPRRMFGAAERLAADDEYLAPFEDSYHAMRPLRLVVDTTSPALARYFERLTNDVAVQIHGEPGGRLTNLVERVRAVRAHFGFWIDGNGESCRVIDECGELVAIESLVVLIAREILAEQPEAKVVVPVEVEWADLAMLPGAQVITVLSTRQSIWQAIRRHKADLAADEHGRIWFAGSPVCADALKALTLLLTLLSRSDRPLSDCIASAIL